MSVDLAEGIRDDLTVHALILTYITANDVHWLDAPVNSNGAKIVYKMISDPALYDSDDKWQRWRFFIDHPSKFKCAELAQIIFDHLNRNNSTLGAFSIDYIECIENTDPEYIEDNSLYQVIQDYMISYH